MGSLFWSCSPLACITTFIVSQDLPLSLIVKIAVPKEYILQEEDKELTYDVMLHHNYELTLGRIEHHPVMAEGH